jgi:FixJ family two-component response regulator
MASRPADANPSLPSTSRPEHERRPVTEPYTVMQVAVVDDDAGVRGALGRLLRVSGYRVQTFASAEEFLESGRPAELDCLIVDVYLGGMSGSDLHAELTAAGQAPPTVLVTAHSDAAITAMLRRSEEVICLRKPFDDSSLLFAIGCVTGRLEAGAE